MGHCDPLLHLASGVDRVGPDETEAAVLVVEELHGEARIVEFEAAIVATLVGLLGASGTDVGASTKQEMCQRTKVENPSPDDDKGDAVRFSRLWPDGVVKLMARRQHPLDADRRTIVMPELHAETRDDFA